MALVAKRILLVEDQRESAQVIQAGLESLQAAFFVKHVTSAEDALKALDKSIYDMLIADVLLPGISGLELMARFRRRNPATKVILVSGVHDGEIRKQVARAGADAFFFKPIEMADLLDAVERIFGIAKSLLPSELRVTAEVAAPDKPSEKVSLQLAELRFNLQALCVALINERGQIIARAGALPDAQVETSLMPHLMSAFFAMSRVSAFAKAEGTDDLMVVRGKDYHLHLASIGATYALLVATKPLAAARMAAVAEAIQKSVTRLSKALHNLEHSLQDDEERPDLAETDPHLEKVLDQAETKPTSPRLVERYWKTTELPPLQQAGVLTYQQAARLGLAPAEDN
jgi:two-component system, OmpR family, response regulator